MSISTGENLALLIEFCRLIVERDQAVEADDMVRGRMLDGLVRKGVRKLKEITLNETLELTPLLSLVKEHEEATRLLNDANAKLRSLEERDKLRKAESDTLREATIEWERILDEEELRSAIDQDTLSAFDAGAIMAAIDMVARKITKDPKFSTNVETDTANTLELFRDEFLYNFKLLVCSDDPAFTDTRKLIKLTVQIASGKRATSSIVGAAAGYIAGALGIQWTLLIALVAVSFLALLKVGQKTLCDRFQPRSVA